MTPNNEHSAQASGRDLPISTRHSIDIARCIRGKSMEKSVALLQRVLEKKEAVPAVRFRQDIPHRPGRISSGRYPQKATKTILSLLNAAQANAENKGLDAQNLVVKTIIANKASRPYRTGRIRGIRARRTHIQIIVEEKEIKESVQTKRVAHKKQQEQIQPKEKKA